MALSSVKIKSSARQQFPGVFSEVTVATGVKDFGTIADGADAQGNDDNVESKGTDVVSRQVTQNIPLCDSDPSL